MMVLDCCAAVEMVRSTDEGKALWSYVSNADIVASSELLHAELSSVFRKYVSARLLNVSDAAAYVEAAASIPDVFYPLSDFRQEALMESINLNHSPHDLFYLLIARRNGCALLTCDQALARLCRHEGIPCVTGRELLSS